MMRCGDSRRERRQNEHGGIQSPTNEAHDIPLE
jgi:hypothetical protein